jgi:hypothetical protein
VIRGEWIEDDGSWENAVARPWGGARTEDSVLCLRRRRLKEWTPHRWTVADVERLADEITTLRRELYEVMEERRNASALRWAKRSHNVAE